MLAAAPLVAYTSMYTNIAKTSPEPMGMSTLADWIEFIPEIMAARLVPPVREWARANGTEAPGRRLLTWTSRGRSPAPRLRANGPS